MCAQGGMVFKVQIYKLFQIRKCFFCGDDMAGMLLGSSDEFFFVAEEFFLYLCRYDMTVYNPHMTLHKLFLNIKKRDVYCA